MKLKHVVEDIKNNINANMIKDKILSDRGIALKGDKCRCWVHNSNSDTVMAYDSVRKRFKCFSCGASVDIFEHYQTYYNVSFVEAVKMIASDFNMSIDIDVSKDVVKVKQEPAQHSCVIDSHIKYLINRGISEDVIKYAGLKSDKKRDAIVFLYNNELGEHISNKYRLLDSSSKIKMMFQKGTNANTLYNMDKVDVTKPLIICEGEIDCLSLLTCGIYNCVSVPTGVHSSEWLKVNWSWIEQFKEITIWFDNDDAGVKGTREIMNRLSNEVVKVARCEGDISDINELLVKEGSNKVIECLKKATIPLVEGVATLDMIEDFNPYNADKIKFGIEGLDRIVLGTLFGTLTILTGRPGHGKSTIINQLYIGEPISQGYKTFLFSGELEASNVRHWVLTTLANARSLDIHTTREGVEYSKIREIAKENMLDKLKDNFFLYCDDNNYTIDYIMTVMSKLAKQNGVKVFVIDNLMVVEDEDQDEYKSQANIVKKLKAFAKKYNVAVVLVAHPKKTDMEIGNNDIMGTSKIPNLADYIAKIERVFDENGLDKHSVFSITKNRPTGRLAKTKLEFNNFRKRFYNIDAITDEPNLSMLNKDYLINDIQNEFELVDGEF